jgi:DNA-binding transcriptional MerR regulator/ubiquinone/menaquinone biosynthesis C-methylase UbiE
MSRAEGNFGPEKTGIERPGREKTEAEMTDADREDRTVGKRPDQVYTTGQFAEKAHVTIRTIRYYDKQDILKPSFWTESGARRYTDADFAKLQQILLFKYLGFSLDEIREMTIASSDPANLVESLRIQKKLIQERIEQMEAMTTAIDRTVGQLNKIRKKNPSTGRSDEITTAKTAEKTGDPPLSSSDSESSSNTIDWSSILNLIHLTAMEDSMKSQYQDASNISARIRLHRDYSTNPEGWFPWVFRQSGIEKMAEEAPKPSNQAVQLSYDRPRVLELGCGSGSLWVENINRIPSNISICLSDVSEGMLKDARQNITRAYQTRVDALGSPRNIRYKAFDCAHISYERESFNLVIADHLLFYCKDLKQTLSEIRRVLKPGGRLLASTYSSKHMAEITDLVQKYNPNIVLSSEKLYQNFGLENGEKILKPFFSDIQLFRYEDSIEISEAEPLIAYILSCHGNQNQLLLNHYKEFHDFVEKKISKGFHITKDAGIFLAEKTDTDDGCK